MTSKQRIVVTGAAGFLGAHVCRALVGRGEQVTGIDNLSIGHRDNLADLAGRPGFELLCADVTGPFAVEGPVRAVVHLACPASPVAFSAMPLATLRAGSAGTLNALELARATGARFLLASSSEVYGDPQVHPQEESYRGNVDPAGPRSAYDEAKRFSEAAAMAYRRHHGVDTAIVRPFNAYGPGMQPGDGRVVAAFCAAAVRGQPLRLHGDGKQTRSLCYVDDMVGGLLAMLDSGEPGPVNLGSSDEITMRELAEQVIAAAGAGAIEFLPARDQDVAVRCPDLTRARELLGWQPVIPLRVGLDRTVRWVRDRIAVGA